MEIVKAKSAGFCFGVERAVEMVYECIRQNPGKKIYTYGPIIHNGEVIKDMENKGVTVLHSEEELDSIREGVVVIRSHGVRRDIYERLTNTGVSILDATCPFVSKIHKAADRETKNGRFFIVIGNPEHPEVEGIVGWANGECRVIQNADEARNIMVPQGKKLFVVAQTTFNYNKFKELVEIIQEKSYDINVLNTICSATKERQTEARSIAESVDAMIVIGDKHSSNTQKLYEICKKACKDTYFIQTLDDLDLNQLRSVRTVGLTAGASTPNNIIEEVQNNVRVIF